MNIIADEDYGNALRKVLAVLKPAVSEPVSIVQIELLDDRGRRSGMIGLDWVIANAQAGEPIVMLGWQKPVTYANDQRWHAALAYPNVVFRRLPARIEEILSGFEEGKAMKRPADPLAIALLSAQESIDKARALEHDFRYAEQQGEERLAKWIERAQEVFGDKPLSELIELVRQTKEKEGQPGQFAGQRFPDVCVDVEGTLFDPNSGAIRQDVLDKVQSLSETKPVTIWTGGDLKSARERIRQAGIPFKLVAKDTMRGATVATVVDDLPEAEFRKTYEIGYEEYLQV